MTESKAVRARSSAGVKAAIIALLTASTAVGPGAGWGVVRQPPPKPPMPQQQYLPDSSSSHNGTGNNAAQVTQDSFKGSLVSGKSTGTTLDLPSTTPSSAAATQ